jgi:hypothetical protein
MAAFILAIMKTSNPTQLEFVLLHIARKFFDKEK